MAECECLPGCPFFNDKMADVPATAQMMKKKYCLGDKTICARHMVFTALGKGTVPGNMFPNMREAAEKLIREKKG